MSLKAPAGYSYPSATETLKRTEKAIEEKKQQKRKEHYDAVFEVILSAAASGSTCIRLQAYQIERYGMREYLESNGYRIGKPFARHSNLAGGRVTFHYIHWGEKGEDTDETV